MLKLVFGLIIVSSLVLLVAFPLRKDNLMDPYKEKLTPEQYHVLREKGTERAFSGKYWDHKKKGTYTCGACDLSLFDSETKFESGTGWPSFWTYKTDAVELKSDYKLVVKRTEVICARCQSHLGHVFDDGPAPTSKRYCINSLALSFKANTSKANAD